MAMQRGLVVPRVGVGSVAGIPTPAGQSRVSGGVGAVGQGGVQGTLTSLKSVAGIVGPSSATTLFGHFASTTPAVPGAAFFLGALLNLLALGVAFRSLRKN